MSYTIEKNGARWVASNGTDHAEGETARSAFSELEDIEQGLTALTRDQELLVDVDVLELQIGIVQNDIVRGIAKRTPIPVLRPLVAKHAELFEKLAIVVEEIRENAKRNS